MKTLLAPHDTHPQSPHLLKSIVIYALIGLAIGVISELIFSAGNSTTYVPGVPAFLAQFDNQNVAVLLERIAYVLLGVVIGLASHLFNIESWSLTKATVVHYLVVLLSLGVCALTLKWMPFGWAMVLGFVVPATVMYMVIWGAMWLRIFSQIKKASEGLSAA